MRVDFRIAIATILLAMCISQVSGQNRSPLPAVHHKPVVIAHRGDHVNFPENTLEAFEEAIRNGVDYVEVDLRTSKDGVLVIMHDESVNRTTNGAGKVRDLDGAAIARLTIKPGISQPSGKYHVPTFAEVLKTCQGRINIYLDFKDADVTLVYKMLTESGMVHHMVVYINAEEQYYEWKRVAPAMPLISSVPESIHDEKTLQHFLDQFTLSAVDGRPGQYTEAMLSVLHKNGVAIWLDVQSKNEGASYWDAILDTHIEGMQSDHPAQLVEHLKRTNRR